MPNSNKLDKNCSQYTQARKVSSKWIINQLQRIQPDNNSRWGQVPWMGSAVWMLKETGQRLLTKKFTEKICRWPLTQSVNQQNLYSAPYKIWTAALNNVKIYNTKKIRKKHNKSRWRHRTWIINRLKKWWSTPQKCQEKCRRLGKTARPSDDAWRRKERWCIWSPEEDWTRTPSRRLDLWDRW